MLIGLIMAGYLTAAQPVYTLDNTYPRAMEIVEVDRKEDTAGCVDAVDLKWKFKGPEDLEVGDIVICIMYDNGTKDTILDDKVIDVYWSGYYFEGNEFYSVGERRTQ